MTSASQDDQRAATHLSRLGVNPVVIQRLLGYAQEDEIPLREFVRYILTDYAPPEEPQK